MREILPEKPMEKNPRGISPQIFMGKISGEPLIQQGWKSFFFLDLYSINKWWIFHGYARVVYTKELFFSAFDSTFQ